MSRRGGDAMKIYISADMEHVDDRRVSWTHADYETAFKMFIGVMRLSRSDPDYG
jgi:hypothetical protein